jgi:retron-type reverse transcriptase
MRSQFQKSFVDIISPENLLCAWQEFVSGKREKLDVQVFVYDLMGNIFVLYDDLERGRYKHGVYEQFAIADPKPRQIHKATVRDRLVHHAIYRQLAPFFFRTFISDSFSCQDGKGTHKALDRFREMVASVSRNHTRTCWVLKCDIKKFFASIDHDILQAILAMYIPDPQTFHLLQEVIESFETAPRKGLPLGNLTSQLFSNIYLNEFDQFVKHRRKVRHYIRYADDFVLLSENKEELLEELPLLQTFLTERLALTMHPDKIVLRTIASGLDFLGWVHAPTHRTLRAATAHRMFRGLQENPTKETKASYLGLLSHGDTFKLSQDVENAAWVLGVW